MKILVGLRSLPATANPAGAPLSGADRLSPLPGPPATGPQTIKVAELMVGDRFGWCERWITVTRMAWVRSNRVGRWIFGTEDDGTQHRLHYYDDEEVWYLPPLASTPAGSARPVGVVPCADRSEQTSLARHTTSVCAADPRPAARPAHPT